MVDKHGPVGRRGDFYDQDQPSGAGDRTTGPARAGFGMLYDQDQPASVDGDWRDELRHRKEAERREHEDLLRQRLEARPPLPASPTAPLRITSRPAPRPDPVAGGAPMNIPSTGQATAVLAAGTFASRVTGFLRVLAIAYVLGVGSLSDAFNYANGVPNIVYDLLLGGILSATLIPVFVEQLAGDDPAEQDRSISAVVTAIGIALVAISAALWLLAPYVIRFYLLLNHSSTGPSERALATRLLRYFAPQVFFLGATVVSTALLNARRRFTAAAFSPVVNNLIAIGALLVTKAVALHILNSKKSTPAGTLQAFSRDQRAILILGLGTTAGYAVQLLVQTPAMRTAGFRLRLVWDLRHPAVRKVARLSTWLVGVVLTNQVSLALVMVLAGRTQGGVTAYQFSYQFFQLPYALIAVSVASAIMPDLASRWTAGNRQAFGRRFSSGLRVTLAVLVPVGLVYVAVAQPFIQLAIHHGRVGQSGAHLVSSSLALFAVGLPGFAAFFLLMRAYQAAQNGRAMFWLYALENAITVIAAVILEPLIGVPGLALAWAGPYTIASVVAGIDLRRRYGVIDGAATLRALVRIGLAAGVAAVVVVLIGLPFPSAARSNDAVLIGRLLVQAGAGAGVYVALAKAMSIREVDDVIRLGRRLLGRA